MKKFFVTITLTLCFLLVLSISGCYMLKSTKLPAKSDIKSTKILQINFKLSVSRDKYEQAGTETAKIISNVAGLRWKVWIMNEAKQELGGIYLFDDESSLEAYLAGPIVAKLKSNPAISDISMKQFDVLDKLTQVTHGPIVFKETKN